MSMATPDAADAMILAEHVAAHLRDGTAAWIDLCIVLPALSQGGREWCIFSTPDAVLRGALNCFCATGSAGGKLDRLRDARAIYHGYGTNIRARIIHVQDAVKAEIRKIQQAVTAGLIEETPAKP